MLATRSTTARSSGTRTFALSDSNRRLLSIAGMLLAWTVASLFFEARLLPSPWEVLQALARELLRGELAWHVGATLARSVVAFAFAMFAGALLGAWLGRSRRADAWLDPWLVVGLNLPALVTIILCYIWFGLNEFAAVLAVVINKAPLVAVLVREGSRAVDRDMLEVGAVFRLPRWQRLREIYLPQLYPQLAAAARSVFALSWKIVLVVELLGRSSGVGFQLRRFFNWFDIAGVLAYTVAFVTIVLLIEQLVLRPAERYCNRWRAT